MTYISLRIRAYISLQRDLFCKDTYVIIHVFCKAVRVISHSLRCICNHPQRDIINMHAFLELHQPSRSCSCSLSRTLSLSVSLSLSLPPFPPLSLSLFLFLSLSLICITSVGKVRISNVLFVCSIVFCMFYSFCVSCFFSCILFFFGHNLH